MMHPDIGSEPPQNCWQVIMRTAMKGGIMQAPDRSLGPPRLLELMLNEEEPNVDGSCEQRDRHMDKKKRSDTHEPYHHHAYQSMAALVVIALIQERLSPPRPKCLGAPHRRA